MVLKRLTHRMLSLAAVMLLGCAFVQGNAQASSGSVGVTIGSKERVMMDQKTYNELMNYLIKAECRRLEKDKISGSSNSNQ